jgi:hypothetical protein
VNNRPFDGRSSETYSYPIDMITVCIGYYVYMRVCVCVFTYVCSINVCLVICIINTNTRLFYPEISTCIKRKPASEKCVSLSEGPVISSFHCICIDRLLDHTPIYVLMSYVHVEAVIASEML